MIVQLTQTLFHFFCFFFNWLLFGTKDGPRLREDDSWLETAWFIHQVQYRWCGFGLLQENWIWLNGTMGIDRTINIYVFNSLRNISVNCISEDTHVYTEQWLKTWRERQFEGKESDWETSRKKGGAADISENIYIYVVSIEIDGWIIYSTRVEYWILKIFLN